MKQNVRRDFNCIDVGCHKGEILDLMLKYAPEGNHFAFEPIPFLYDQLKTQYEGKAHVFPFALSDKNGESTFQLVKNALAYSGINKRTYNVKNPDIQEISVQMKTLDEIIPTNINIHFVKIDVEGGEFGVLKGAKKLLMISKPIVIFEFGKGASDHYGTSPYDIFNFITNEVGLKIYTLKSFINKKQPLKEVDFVHYYTSNTEYYFIASV
jgi:FkbM family methyltransferase